MTRLWQGILELCRKNLSNIFYLYTFMEKGTLTKYSASAGSGKTFELTARYMARLLKSPGQSYRRILAVTFTNKAAAEMKRKILDHLAAIAAGERTKMAERLITDTGFSFDELKIKSGRILFSILHDYSFFNVGTIDSFFQRIIRAFARETGLQHGYQIEIEHRHVLDRAVDMTLEDAKNDRALMNWLIRYEYDRIEEGKSWNIKNDITSLAGEVFRERFRLMDEDDRKRLSDKDFLEDYIGTLKKIRKDFSTELIGLAQKCRALLNRHNVTDDMFFRGNSGGIGSFLQKIEKEFDGICPPPGATVLKVKDPEPVWTSKAGPSPQLKAAFDDGFKELFLHTLGFYERGSLAANTALLIIQHVYILGILSDILRNVHIITTAENRFLLSDAGEFLYRLTSADQTPFIYEKAGNNYENFMIDEFQDTSVIQWNNFLPLVENSMAGGHDNLVVGDVKQSIYRWRNGDWRIMGKYLAKQIKESRILDVKLDTNYRSLKNVVAFNNALFTVLPRLIDESAVSPDPEMTLASIYSDTRQMCHQNREGGLVRIEFLRKEEDDFMTLVLQKLPRMIEELQDKGFRASDIGILVRYNNEGAAVINSVIGYSASAGEEKNNRYNYSIVSGESLFLNASPAVSFIIALFTYLLNQSDNLSLAVMIRSWLIATGNTGSEKDLSDTAAQADELWPADWRIFISRLRQKPVFEAVEQVIRYFSLGSSGDNSSFLHAFQDAVFEYSVNFSTDIQSFLEWWELYGPDKSLALSDRQDSIKVMTIHKAKGLEFRAVIVPFITWPLGHGRKNPIIWVNPSEEPFNRLSLVPVKYKNDLQYSFFSSDYSAETYNARIDNLNLLYVAFTRAREILIGFCPDEPEKDSIAGWLKSALAVMPVTEDDKPLLHLPDYFHTDNKVFLAGKYPETEAIQHPEETPAAGAGEYFVGGDLAGLHIKLHGEKWFLKQDEKQKSKLNYGRLMHDILSAVFTPEDIPGAVRKMVLDGRITEKEGSEITERITLALETPQVKEWFGPDLKILTETDILAPGGDLRRPDRIILSGNKATVVDFKFGNVRDEDIRQVTRYRRLLNDMGFENAEAFIWYVDGNKVVKVE